MLDIKKIDLGHIGSLVLLGVILVLVAYAIMHFASPLLVTSGIITNALTLTDTLLLLILVRTFAK